MFSLLFTGTQGAPGFVEHINPSIPFTSLYYFLNDFIYFNPVIFDVFAACPLGCGSARGDISSDQVANFCGALTHFP